MINSFRMRIIATIVLLFNFMFFTQLFAQNSTNGIFLEDGDTELHASLLGGNEFKKTAVSFITFGAVPSERIPFLLNASSGNNIKNQSFVFSFSNNDPFSDTGTFDRGFRDSKSPKEFILLRLKTNKRRNHRQIFKQKTSWQERVVAALVPFTSEQVEPGVFSVTPNSTLEAGEYCFVHQDILNAPIFSDFAFYDFSIEK
ncbi:hypothetical protein [Croceivirga thetidis]|uniref:Uncharacterized protein n=1 Tax=Croceivirga thetidis TaxID=2721623 RepID=A0ABX1GKQ9_9FLAO|nr:hypothetical protein [Croceivirga thetidis]NKI30482.1 hypothetical protein [Croceivirga thetidis]